MIRRARDAWERFAVNRVRKRMEVGDEAKVLLANPLLKQALSRPADEALAAFKVAETPDQAWNAALEWRAAERVVGFLAAAVADGESAAKALQRDRHDPRAEYSREQRREHAAYLQAARDARKAYAEGEEEAA